MKVSALELQQGDVIGDQAQSGVIADIDHLDAHVRVWFADGQGRSYPKGDTVVLVCSRLAACPLERCDVTSCQCKPCGCRVCAHRATVIDAAGQRADNAIRDRAEAEAA